MSDDSELAKAIAAAEVHAKNAALDAANAKRNAEDVAATKATMDRVLQDAKETQKTKFIWGVSVTAGLTVVCLVGAAIVGFAEIDVKANGGLAGRMQIARFVCCLGMAFAILGFGLFLIGATGSFTGDTTGEGKGIKVDTTAPGLVVMVCATVVIYFGVEALDPPVAASSVQPGTEPSDQRGAKTEVPQMSLSPDAGVTAVDAQ